MAADRWLPGGFRAPLPDLTGLEWRFVSSQQDEAARQGAAPEGARSVNSSRPAAGHPATSQGDSRQPVTRDEARPPAAPLPDTSKPDTSKPEVAEPDAAEPEELRLTAPADPAQASADSLTAGKAMADGKILYRRLTPTVLWWVWLAFAVFCLADVVIPAHNYLSIEFVAGLLAVTAAVYACTIRPRVIADDDSVVIHNPFREHRVSWGSVRGVFLGDSIEFSCARPAPKKDKSVYCWALYTARRPRMRAQMQRSLLKPARTARALEQTADLNRKDPVQEMAAELGRRCREARERGVPDAVLESRWAWPPLVGTLALVAVALLLILV